MFLIFLSIQQVRIVSPLLLQFLYFISFCFLLVLANISKIRLNNSDIFIVTLTWMFLVCEASFWYEKHICHIKYNMDKYIHVMLKIHCKSWKIYIALYIHMKCWSITICQRVINIQFIVLVTSGKKEERRMGWGKNIQESYNKR